MKEDNIRVEDMMNALKSRWMLIVAITLLLTIGSAFMSFFMIKPQYEASTKLFIGKEENSEQAYSSNDVQLYQNLLKTYSNVIKTEDLVGRSINKTGLDLSAGSVLNSLTVTPNAGTQILEIKYEGTDKNEVKEIVESITNEFIKVSTDLISNANVRVIESAKLPINPVSPNKQLNIIIACILGIMIGCAVAIILEIMDNTFKEKDQVERVLDVPVIGVIPNIE